MTVSPSTISMLDEEDTQICEHEIAIAKAKHTKEEWQRQCEEEACWEDEAEKVRREAKAEKAWRVTEAEEA